jgi:hypothetical protein
MKQVLVADLIESDEAGFACSKTRLVETGLPHLRPFNIGSDGALDLSEVYEVDPREAPKGKGQLLAGDLLFNNTNSAELVGKSAVVTAPMTAGFSNHLTRVRVNRSRVDPLWLSFWLRKLQASGYFTANATQWVSQAAYRTSDLGRLRIDLPSLPEQRVAVDLLSRAEGIVRLRRLAQKKAAELIPALLVDMVGDPATNPKGWPDRPLGELLTAIDSGQSPKCHDRPRADDEWGVLRLSAISRCDSSAPRSVAPERSRTVASGCEPPGTWKRSGCESGASVARIKSATSGPEELASDAALIAPVALETVVVIAPAKYRQVRSLSICSAGSAVRWRNSVIVAGSAFSSRIRSNCESETHLSGTLGAPRK